MCSRSQAPGFTPGGAADRIPGLPARRQAAADGPAGRKRPGHAQALATTRRPSGSPPATIASRRSTFGVRRAVARVGGVLGEHGEAVFGRLGVERAEGLLQVVVHGQRALLARHVLDAGAHRAAGVDQFDALDAVDGGKLGEVVLNTWLGWITAVTEFTPWICHAAWRGGPYLIRSSPGRPASGSRPPARPAVTFARSARRRSSGAGLGGSGWRSTAAAGS